MYADLDVGCYLLWEGWPRYRVFQDARLPAYPDAFHRALDETPLAPAAFDALLGRFDVDAALLSDPGINMRAGSFDPDEWALVWRTDDALVFARRLPKYAALIARAEVPLRPRFSFAEGTRWEPLATPPPRSPVDACEWQRRLAAALEGDGDPERALDARSVALARGCPVDEAEVRYFLGARLQREGQLTRARAEYDRVLALRPDDTRALTNRGFARLLDDPEGARADFSRALAVAPDDRQAQEGLARLRCGAPDSRPRATASTSSSADRTSR
jgi:tetratricopeptide (TPR) repeat protein